jgi:hypothetical protein
MILTKYVYLMASEIVFQLSLNKNHNFLNTSINKSNKYDNLSKT